LELLLSAADFLLHLDTSLAVLLARYGAWFYAILFAAVFAETGFVVTPFLPGDSMLFVAGALAAAGGLDPWVLVALLVSAALLGNTTNYWIGRWVGPRAFQWEQSRWFNRRALDRTHAFFERFGAVTIMLARFIPFVRTFAPFVAGVGTMAHARFQLWNALGALAWVGGFVALGYFFGAVEVVRQHLAIIIVVVVAVSLLPLVAGAWRARLGRNRQLDGKGRTLPRHDSD